MFAQERAARVSFGSFEVDLEAGELWKAGCKVRLPGQPFKVLTTLLAKKGKLVSREELQIEVWGNNTNVDFDRALAGAINKIREALGDSAECPIYIQTLPKRGYRFIAEVYTLPTPTDVLKHGAEGEDESTHYRVEGPDKAAEIGQSRSTAIDVPPEFQAHDFQIVPREIPRGLTVLMKLLLAGCMTAMVSLSALLIWLWKGQTVPAPLRVSVVTRSGDIYAGPPNLENLLTMSTDGDRIITSVMVDGRSQLSSISSSTGEVIQIPLPRELASSSLADISRDGAKLLLKGHLSSSSEQPLWIVPSSGGSAQRVGDILAHDASWMPDGASLLIATGNDLSILHLDKGVSTPFAHLQGRAFWMRWSPDSRVLRFTLVDPVTHTLGIWQMQRPGGTPQRVRSPEPGGLSVCCGSWTADGRTYVMQVGQGDLWSLEGEGRNGRLTQLTNGPLRYFSPVAARSGSQIFFLGLSQPLGAQEFDGAGGFRPVPAFLADATRIDLSRDGKWIAWSNNDGKLWRAHAEDGSDKVQLSPDYLAVFMAHWSPDGRRLAVMAREHGQVWRTYLIDADGGTPQPLLHEDRNAADPSWSADGKSLVFGREPDSMGKESGSHALYILHLDTMKMDTVPGSEGLFSPRWSPDGRWIVALTLDQKSLMLYDVQQARWTELGRTSASDPAWSADSKYVYVDAYLADKQPIIKVAVPSGEFKVFADLSSFRDHSTTNYFFGGLTAQDKPLILPRTGTGDLYTLDVRKR